MGSKRDGVSVPYDAHGVRPARQVRAAVRDGTHPSVMDEVPPHKKKRVARKRFLLRYHNGHQWVAARRSYRSMSAAENAAWDLINRKGFWSIRLGSTVVDRVRIKDRLGHEPDKFITKED